MEAPPVPMTTDRLTLRRVAESDAEDVFAYHSDPEVAVYLSFNPAREVSESASFIQRCESAWDSGEAFPIAITSTPDNRLIGIVELRPTGHGVELGYVLARSQWGKGYMVEAVQAVAEWVFRETDEHRVWALTDIDNHASQRVLEKAGFLREGVLHRWSRHPNVSPDPRDVAMFALWR